MSLFKKNSPAKASLKPGLIFIGEDNLMYAKSMQFYIKQNFPFIQSVEIFQVGEIMLSELHRKPDLIIMDYYLDSKFTDAQTGLDIIKEIRVSNPQINIVLVTAQQDFAVVLETIKERNCTYIKKDESTFKKIGDIITNIIPSQ